MRTFNWNKLPVNKILGKKNIWSLVAKKNESPKKVSSSSSKSGGGKKPPLINFEDMEHLFCQQQPTAPSSQSSPTKDGQNRDESDKGKKKDEVSETTAVQAKLVVS